MPRKLLLNGKVYDCRPGESVLDALLRQKVDVPFACRQQLCMSCIMRSLNGAPPKDSQRNIKDTLCLQNNFLACNCYPERDMEITLSQEIIQHQVVAEVVQLNKLNHNILEVIVQCQTPLDYRAGQAVLLMNSESIGKRIPISTPTSAKSSGRYELHVERISGGYFSEWVHYSLTVGDKVTLCGADGELCYIENITHKPLLLAGWNSGLSALMGVLQDAFEYEHQAPIWLFHGVTRHENLYLIDEMREIGEYYPNFHYVPYIEHLVLFDKKQTKSLTEIVRHELPQLSGWNVYLCGPRNRVHEMQRQCYLSGAAMKEIYQEITEL